MIDKLKVLEIIQEKLREGEIFLVDLKISSDSKINVTIDGDNGVTISDCITISRAIESSLDREENDFELNVLSAGVGQPLKLTRQYIKNVGRTIHVLKNDLTEIEGELVSADEQQIEVEVEIKKGNSKKNISKVTEAIQYADIKEAKIIIKF